MKKKSLVVALVLILVVGVVCVTAFARERSEKAIQLPDSVTAAIKKAYPSADVKKVGLEELTITAYEVELSENGKEISVVLSDDGNIVSVESVISTDALPAKVAAIISEKAEGAKVLKAEKEDKYFVVKMIKLSDAQVSYEAKVVKDGQEYEIVVDSNGNLINIKADEAKNYDEDDDEGEDFISFSQLPEAVKGALKAAAGDGTIEEIQQEKDDGQMSYEAEIIIDSKKYEIKIDSNGKVLKKKRSNDNEDDEDNDYDDND